MKEGVLGGSSGSREEKFVVVVNLFRDRQPVEIFGAGVSNNY